MFLCNALRRSPARANDCVTTGHLEIWKDHRFLLDVLAEALPWTFSARDGAKNASSSKPAP